MSSCPTIRTPAELRARLASVRRGGARIGLIPTMGALHAGHLSLIAQARSRTQFTVASIFVNPAQFAPDEDFQAYPRDEEGDVRQLATAGCDLVYAPIAEAMYPEGFSTTVNVSGVSAPLEGVFRPDHFVGVATVVAKLLIQAAPDVAAFGEKDYQQLQVIRRLARDLDLAVEIIGAPIVREPDGLALSSRNVYLTPAERTVAPMLHQTLANAAAGLAGGWPVADAEAEAVEVLLSAGFGPVDYLEVRGAEGLERLGPGPLTGPARILAAARLGRTRLIDNLAIWITTPPGLGDAEPDRAARPPPSRWR